MRVSFLLLGVLSHASSQLVVVKPGGVLTIETGGTLNVGVVESPPSSDDGGSTNGQTDETEEEVAVSPSPPPPSPPPSPPPPSPPPPSPPPVPSTVAFTYTGVEQELALGTAQKLIHVQLWGAGGGKGEWYHGGVGGYSAASIQLPNTATLLKIIVGGKGMRYDAAAPRAFGGGGAGGASASQSAGGGGRSAIRISGDVHDLVTAGGGGGGGYKAGGSGGNGGGTQGTDALCCERSDYTDNHASGNGGSQSGGGSGGHEDVDSNYQRGNPGTQYQGGDGNSNRVSGGGGGGYYGGGGGGGRDYVQGGGGGGSGFVGPTYAGSTEGVLYSDTSTKTASGKLASAFSSEANYDDLCSGTGGQGQHGCVIITLS